MARENQQQKINRLAATAIHLSDTIRAMMDAFNLKLPLIEQQLDRAEELVYGCIPGDEKNQRDFGLCLLGIKGNVGNVPEIKEPELAETVPEPIHPQTTGQADTLRAAS